jgi:O-antigen/teichoic acid export membrane protein
MPTSPLPTLDAEATGQPAESNSVKDDLMRRAPMSYLWNQIGSLIQFGSLLVFSIAIARALGPARYGVLAVALTTYNTVIYITAFGLEDSATVFVPRTYAEKGRAAAASVIRRVLFARFAGVAIVSLAAIFGIRLLADGLLAIGLTSLGHQIAGWTSVPGLDALVIPMSAYAAGTGFMNLLGSLFTSLLRTKLTTTVNSLGQVANLALALLALHLGFGISGVLWALAASTWGGTLVYLVLMGPLLAAHESRREKAPPFGPVLRLGSAAWITNLISGALLKQVAVSLLLLFIAQDVVVGYFNIAFQLSHAAAYLLIAGLGGVGMAAMAASYSGEDRPGLAFAWRAVSKVQILLSVPLLAFCFIHAQAIVNVFYPGFAPAGTLMQIFLIFNIAQRLAGGGSHQAALYVLGYQRLALFTQYAGIALTIILSLILIPRGGAIGGPVGGAAGALIAVGIGQVGVEITQLIMAWVFLKRKYPLRFGLRVCLALILPLLLAVFWHPSAILPALHLGPIHVSATFSSLVVSVTAFTLVLLVGLYLTKPIEFEDVDLLAQVNARLRPILLPFASGAPSQIRVKSVTPTTPLASKAAAVLHDDAATMPRLRASRPMIDGNDADQSDSDV